MRVLDKAVMSDLGRRKHKRRHTSESEHQSVQESKRQKAVIQLLDCEGARGSLSDDKPTSAGHTTSDSGTMSATSSFRRRKCKRKHEFQSSQGVGETSHTTKKQKTLQDLEGASKSECSTIAGHLASDSGAISDSGRSKHRRKHASGSQEIEGTHTAKKQTAVPQIPDCEDASDSLSDDEPSTSAGHTASDSKWKKLYYALKAGDAGDKACAKVERLWLKTKGSPRKDWLQRISRIVEENFQHLAPKLEKYVKDRLHHHPQYSCVRKILQLKQKQETVLGVIPPLVVCSKSVYEVYMTIQAVVAIYDTQVPTSPSHSCEIFYLLASLLFYLWAHYDLLPQRFHYFLFYALNVLEECTGGETSHIPQHSGQHLLTEYFKPLPSVDIPGTGGGLTMEQQNIINHRIKEGDMIKVVAYAGAGKTTTLVKVAEANQDLKFLYVAFNRSVKDNATKQKLFPKNVTVDTLHGFANKALDFKRKFNHKPYSSISTWQVAVCISEKPIANLEKFDQQQLFKRARNVLKTLEQFISSSDPQITSRNIPHHILRNLKSSEVHLKQLVSEAAEVWEKMQNPQDRSVMITHDGYMKLYQLQKPEIPGFDCILVDEAQDLTPAQTDILNRQRCAKILVGDPHQQIYSFRGAENSMDSIEGPTFYLTKSFRFGPSIAYTASCILYALKKDAHVRSHLQTWTLTGRLTTDSHISVVNGRENGQVAIICRKNTTLFDKMVETCRRKDVKFGFAGGISSYGFDDLLDIHKLQQGNTDNIKKKFSERFRSFGRLKIYAQSAKDYLLLGKIKICEKYQSNLPILVQQIRERNVKRNALRKADVIFTTAHRAKGLEFDTVKLADDFLREPVEDEDDPTEDPINLLYVAITRAKKQLVMSPTLLRVLKEAKENLIFPMSEENGQVIRSCCCVCSCTTHMPELPMEKACITLSSEKERPGGLVCKKCLSNEFPCMAELFNEI